MGGSPTPISFGEVYTAMQQGVVDGAENNVPSWVQTRHIEIAKVFSEDEHASIPDFLVISSKTWDKLTPGQQQILVKAAKASEVYQQQLWQKIDADTRAQAKALGGEIIKVDKAPFRAAVQPLFDDFKKDPKQAALLAIKKNGLTCSDIQLLFAGDLLAQTSASSFGTADLKIPFYGLFGACSTMGESLSLGSMCIDGGYGKYILCATSSHFASAEKEFRFPLGYGNQRPLSATWTVTGAGACILGYEPPPRPDNKTLNTLRNRNICAVITGITTGRLIDFGFRDSLNMGACMAPAACDTIARNLQDFHRKPSDYDAIFTGDLGIPLSLKKGL